MDPDALRGYVEHSADTLIDRIGPRGRADLLNEYGAVLPLLVFNRSLSANGSVKIWEEADCKSRSATVQGNVNNLADIRFTTIKSIRFAG